jgi:flagellar biosynthesis/type III secretory pathway protein FliH
MQRVEKQRELEQHSSHCFPSIEKSLENTSCQSESACNAFRPMFQVHDPSSGKGDLDSGNCKRADSAHDTLEQIKEKCFLKGLEAGKADACNLVRKELEAPVHQFLNSTERYSNCYCRITKSYSGHIVELALAIARKILGDSSGLNREHLAPISGQLHTLLKAQYRFSAKFNRDSIESLTELLSCVSPQWKSSDALEIAGDDEIRKGQVQLDDFDASIEAVKNKFKQMVEETLQFI